MICTCGHEQTDHVPTLFGIECEGRQWHDDSDYSCACTEFRPTAKEEYAKWLTRR